MESVKRFKGEKSFQQTFNGVKSHKLHFRDYQKLSGNLHNEINIDWASQFNQIQQQHRWLLNITQFTVVSRLRGKLTSSLESGQGIIGEDKQRNLLFALQIEWNAKMKKNKQIKQLEGGKLDQ